MMIPDQWYIEGCLKSSKEDKDRFERWTRHLPKRNEFTPYHSGAHSIRSFEMALSMFECGIGNILEIGFCLGHSASIFLELGARTVVSVENSDSEETIKAMYLMKGKWGDRFRFVNRSKADLIRNQDWGFSMAYIDGDHSEASINEDVDFVLSMGVKTILFDDWFPQWGETQIVLSKRGVCPLAIIGTMALCEFP